MVHVNLLGSRTEMAISVLSKRWANRKNLRYITIILLGLMAIGCRGPAYNLPPADRLAAPGPGVNGPGPGVLSPGEMIAGPAGAAPASLASFQCDGEIADPSIIGGVPSVQVLFRKPGGMRVAWDDCGQGTFSATPLVAPARTNFRQAGLYRLKLTHIPAHEGLELYPTIEVAPATPRTHAFLAHNTVPVQWTVDDLNQIAAGNFVTKVIYLPDPDFQHLAVAGVETLVSTRLDPGIDPIVEADRRGSILAIVRTGNKDIEMPGMQGDVNIGYSTFAGESSGPIAQTSAVFGAGIGLEGHVTGVNSPAYGLPITGTPIGLPGAPAYTVGRSGRAAQARAAQLDAHLHPRSVTQGSNQREAKSAGPLPCPTHTCVDPPVQPSELCSLHWFTIGLCSLRWFTISVFHSAGRFC